MKPHKWAKEIKAWADGAEIEWRATGAVWMPCPINFTWQEDLEYRIKPQPKEPQYLYVYRGMAGDVSLSRTKYDSCIGKIKLEKLNEI